MAVPSLEVDFIRERAGAVDPAFSTPSTFDKQRGLVGPKIAKHELHVAMRQYQALNCEPKLDFDVNNCSWPEVFKLLETVQEDYVAKAQKGILGPFRRMARGAGESSDEIQQLLTAIPDEFGGSVIQAGLGWMLTIAKQCTRARREIFELFSDIPSIVENITKARQLFKHDKELAHLAESAETEIVNATLKLIKYLLPKHQAEKVFAISPDVPSAASVSEIVTKVRKLQHALQQRSDDLTRNLIIDTGKNTRVIQKEVQTTRLTAVITKGLVEETKEQVGSISQALLNMYQDLRQSEKNLLNSLEAGVQATNGLFRHFREMKEDYEATKLQLAAVMESGFARVFSMEVDSQMHRAFIPQPVLLVNLTPDQLLCNLNVTGHEIGDLEQVLRQSSRLDPFALTQAQQLLRQDRFWSWYCRSSSDFVMVQGTFKNEGTANRMSPLSATSATLVTIILRERPGDIVLYFFCGQHTSSQDPLAGPQGVMRCLLARLLVEAQVRSQFNICFEPSTAGAVAEGIRQHNMDAMCFMFESLLMHVAQGTTVYCVIDGILWIDQPQHMTDTIRMFQLFRSLATDSGIRPSFKLMLTGPWPSSSFDAFIRPEERISLIQGSLMQSAAARVPLFNRNTLSPLLYQPQPLQNRQPSPR